MFHTMLRCYLISRNMYQMMRGSRYSIPGIRLFDIERRRIQVLLPFVLARRQRQHLPSQ